MSMERWNPFRDMDVMRQAMDRWFDDRLGNYFTGSGSSNQVASVAVDVHETENGYELAASLPGVRPEDVDITINRDTVTLRGRSEQTTQRQQGNYIYRERHSGTFQRTIRLPEPINADQTEATLENGVLRLTLPRLQQTPNRRVQVRTGSNSGSQSLNTQNTGAMQGQSSQTGSSPNMSSTQNTGNNQGMVNSQSSVGKHFGGDQGVGSSQTSNTQSMGSQNTGTSQTGTATASQSGRENVPVRNNMESGIDSPGAATTTMGGNISRDIGSPEVSTMSGSNNQGGNMGGSQSNMGNTGSSQSSSQRPSVLQGLGSNELASLETHIVSNDQEGFMRLAGSYGWDQQSCQQVWDFMTHNPSSSEANTAFGSSNQQSNSAQM